MKSKEMRKMIDKYIPMMVSLSEIDNNNSEINMIEVKAAAILDSIIVDTEKTAKKSLINCIMNCSLINYLTVAA